ncbi:HNH endonuclease signature motif containing protein [Kibdelosporangium persicum]|uniref:HNH endonuclease n=1 Tax=Kibdelosporangium persicum TaxID=2698649 RepID=A0ABX2EYS5_9PSEU|nr:HNH endonuclease signature motif containing protein [Kibdelosporangium persicum]NRN64193.1 HNH endonuclease [Kibdelosporangium persicum]
MSESALDHIRELYQARSRAEAQYIRGLAGYAAGHPPDRDGISVGDGVAEEVALELHLSPATTAKHLAEAQDMVSRLPMTVNALEAGEIDYMRAKAVRDYTKDLAGDQVAEVEKRILAGGPRESLTKFKYALNREVIRVDPEAAEERRRLAKARRGVTKWHKPDGTAKLSVTLRPDEAEQAYNHIDLLARQAKVNRADVFMDLVCGKKSERTPAAVHVVVPMTTLLGLNREPGEISGVGPITAEHARELARHATWRRLITDPTGQVLEVSRRRFASPALRRHLQLRDRTCRQPGCNVPAHRCETDHTKSYVTGGPTSPGNIAMFCKRHNLMRQRTKWRLRQPEPGTLVFTTPTKRIVVTKPEPYEPITAQ